LSHPGEGCGRFQRGLILRPLMDGWNRIQTRHRFTEPESSESIREDARAVVSSISLFMSQRCELVAGQFTETADLYRAWVTWCK
jgi:putative DNA primase/helicase